MIRFEVPGVPVAQSRQKHTTKRTKAGKTFMQNYTPKRDPVNAFKATVAQVASQHVRVPITGPVRISIEFIFPRLLGMVCKKKAMDRQWEDSKPDSDNLEKSTWDALKGIAWNDDAQVCDSRVVKFFASGDEVARTIITIEPLTSGPPQNERNTDNNGIAKIQAS